MTDTDGDPVAIENAAGRGDIVLVCEHASRRVPERLGSLGLSPQALESHIAWDPGALAVAEFLSRKLDAVLIYQRFSRLAYDCNRPPEADGAMPAVSEVYEVPGNRDMAEEERRARVDEIYLPFHDAISQFVTERKAKGRPPVVVTMHSFTPVYFGKPRSVEVGILHDADSRLADQMLTFATRGKRRLRYPPQRALRAGRRRYAQSDRIRRPQRAAECDDRDPQRSHSKRDRPEGHGRLSGRAAQQRRGSAFSKIKTLGSGFAAVLFRLAGAGGDGTLLQWGGRV